MKSKFIYLSTFRRKWSCGTNCSIDIICICDLFLLFLCNIIYTPIEISILYIFIISYNSCIFKEFDSFFTLKEAKIFKISASLSTL